MLRLVESGEKALVSDRISKEKQDTKQLGKLEVGESYCYYSYMRAPYRVVTPHMRVDEHTRLDASNERITQKMHYWSDRQMLLNRTLNANDVKAAIQAVTSGLECWQSTTPRACFRGML